MEIRKRPMRSVLITALALLPVMPAFNSAEAAQWFAGPRGSDHNRGTLRSPWNLEYALSNSSPSRPGDTIWVLGGTYSGRFYCGLEGTAQRQFVVRNYNGQRVTLSTAPTGPVYAVLEVGGTHTLIWGIEIAVTRAGTETPIDGIRFHETARFNRLVNCVVHNATNSGIADQDAVGTELYGNIVYYSGRREQGGNAYAVYGQNHEGFPPKLYEDNIFLHTFAGYTLHMYSEGQNVDSIIIRHNVVANTVGHAQLMFSSAKRDPRGIVVDSNYFWGASALTPLLTERKGLTKPMYRGNYFLRGTLLFRSSTRNRSFEGNYVWGAWPVETTSGKEPPWPRIDTLSMNGNAWYLGNGGPVKTPPINRVFVRPNKYERGRGTIVVYNLSRKPAVEVDLSDVVRPGAAYEIRDAQNFLGPPVVSGKYSGTSILIPMRGGTVPSPVSRHPEFPAPSHTGPEFGVFVVLPVRP